MATAQAKRVALVTGGNRGIGYGIVKALVRPDWVVLLGSRKGDDDAEKKIRKETSNRGEVKTIQIDLDDEKSVAAAASKVLSDYGGLDVLVNNAAIAFKGDAFDENVARTTMKTNYFGTKRVCRHFLNILRENGRVVVVSSMAGRYALGRMSAGLQKKFLDESLTEKALDDLVEKFCSDVKQGTYAEQGWPKTAYGVSKTAVSMYTRMLARDNIKKGVLINACCPGYVATDMSSFKGPLTVEEGARTPVKLATLSAGQPTGKFWEKEAISEFV